MINLIRSRRFLHWKQFVDEQLLLIWPIGYFCFIMRDFCSVFFFFFYFINLSTSVLISNPEKLKEQIYSLYTSRREICFLRLEITWVFFSEILTYLHIYCKCFSNVLDCGVLKDTCIKLIIFFIFFLHVIQFHCMIKYNTIMAFRYYIHR